MKRTRSLDKPSNQLQSVDYFDQKENFVSDDNSWLDEDYRHDNTLEDHSDKLHNSNTGFHSNTMTTATTWRTIGVNKSVQLFNSPYMVDNMEDSSVVLCSNKKRKTASLSNAITMVTNTGTIVTRSKPSRNICYGSKVSNI